MKSRRGKLCFECVPISGRWPWTNVYAEFCGREQCVCGRTPSPHIGGRAIFLSQICTSVRSREHNGQSVTVGMFRGCHCARCLCRHMKRPSDLAPDFRHMSEVISDSARQFRLARRGRVGTSTGLDFGCERHTDTLDFAIFCDQHRFAVTVPRCRN